MVWWWKSRNQNYIERDDEDNLSLTNITTVHENQTNELFYKLFVNDVLEEIICHTDLTYEYLMAKHPSFMRKFRSNLVEKLFAHHALIDIYNKLESQKHIIVDGFFCKKALKDGILRLCSDTEIQHKVRRGKAIQILLQPFMEVQAAGNISRFGSDYIEILIANSSTDLMKENGGKYTVQLYPNYKENAYALNGIKAIVNDEKMLEKLYALEVMDIKGQPKAREFSFEEFVAFVMSTTDTSKKTLICSQSSSCLKELSAALKKTVPHSYFFKKGYCNPHAAILRYATPPPNSIEFSSISSRKLKSFKLVICGVDPAYKFADNITNQHFDNIFICSAHLISEMHAWMLLGKLANVKTKIFICSKLDGRGVKTRMKILDHDEIGYYVSIFDRLCSLSSHSCSEEDEKITVFEL